MYSKAFNDFDYDPSIMDISNPLQIYLDQIRNILATSKGEVAGASDMGVDLEHFVFDTVVNETHLEQLIYDQIIKYCPLYEDFNTAVNVSFSRGVVRDVCMVDINIDGKQMLQLQIK
jgi:phage baseplate assembly protein W